RAGHVAHHCGRKRRWPRSARAHRRLFFRRLVGRLRPSQPLPSEFSLSTVPSLFLSPSSLAGDKRRQVRELRVGAGGAWAMNGIIAFALRMRALMVAFYVLVMIAGVVSFVRLNIEAYPDPVPPLVDIITQNPGQSAEEIERYITIPIEVGVATAPYLNAMRTISLFGLSDVKLQFTYDLTYEEAEQKVLNRLSQLPPLQNQA